MKIGPQIRKNRVTQHVTLEDLAKRCDVTKSMLSKIETAKSMPTVAMLSTIAEALGMTVSALVDDSPLKTTTVMTPAANVAGNKMTGTAKGYRYFMFAQGLHRKIMDPFLFVLKKGQIRRGRVSHDGEEFVYVLKGKVLYRVGGDEFTLGPGDSLYFCSADEHDFEPLTEEVQYLGIMTTREEKHWWKEVKYGKKKRR